MSDAEPQQVVQHKSAPKAGPPLVSPPAPTGQTAAPADPAKPIWNPLHATQSLWGWLTHSAPVGSPAAAPGSAAPAGPAPAPTAAPTVAPTVAPGVTATPAPGATTATPPAPAATETAKKGPPDPKKVAADANEIGKAMDSFLFTDKKAVANALRGKTAEEIAAIRAEYKLHFGRDMDSDIAKKIGSDQSNESAREVQVALQGDPAKSVIEGLKNASQGGWFGRADSSKIKDILANCKDPEVLKAVKEQYKGPNGESLDAMLTQKLGGTDQKLAKSYLTGQESDVEAAKINEKLHGGLFGGGGFLGTGWGRDNTGVQDILENSKDRKALTQAYKSQGNGDVTQDALKGMSGTQRDITVAALAGDKSGADAGRVKAATEGWFTDKKAIYKAMEGKNPDEIKKMKEAYNAHYGPGKGPEGSTTEEKALVGGLTLIGSPLAPIAALRSMRAHRADGMDFDQMLDSNLGGLDHEKAKLLESTGAVSDAFALKYAMHSGFFTDKEAVKKVLGGKDGEGLTPEQLATLNKDYVELQKKDKDYKPGSEVDLNTDIRQHTGSLSERGFMQNPVMKALWKAAPAVAGAVNPAAGLATKGAADNPNFLLGRDGMEIRQLMRGRAANDGERVERANEMYQFERGSGSNPISNFAMDLVNNRGKDLDRQNQLLNQQYQQMTKGGGTPAEQAELKRRLGWQSMDTKSYQETKDSVSNAAAAGVTIVTTAALTVATAGAASPALIAAAGGLAGMGTKMVLQASDYGVEDAGADLANTAVSTATAGLIKVPGVDKAFSSTVGITEGVAPTLMQSVGKEVLTNFATGSVNSAVGAAINPATYSGSGDEAMYGILKAGGLGGLSSAVTAGSNKYLGAKLPENYLGSTVAGATSAALGNVVNPAAYTGNAGDMMAQWATTVAGGGLNNAAGLKAEAMKKAGAIKAAPNTADPSAAAPEGEQKQKPLPPAKEPEPVPATAPKEAPLAVKPAASDSETAATIKTVAASPPVAEAIVKNPKAAQTVAEHPETAKVVAANPENAAVLAAHPEKAAAIAKQPELAGQLKQNPELGAALTPEQAKTDPAKGGTRTVDAQGKAMRPLSADELTLNQLKAEARTPQDHEQIKRWQEEIDARRSSDVEALKQLASEAQQRKEQGGVVEVQDTRALKQFAHELGVPREQLPTHSTNDEILQGKRVPKETLKDYENTRNKDQQASITDKERESFKKKQRDGSVKEILPSATLDATGKQRPPATAKELAAALDVNISLFEDIRPGAQMSKIIPESKVGEYLYGRIQKDGSIGYSVAGDVGLARNHEGMNADNKARHNGLDYKGSEYTVKDGQGVHLDVHPDVKEKMYQVDWLLTKQQADAARVPMGVDMVKAAEARRSQMLADLQKKATEQGKSPSPEELERQLPRLLQKSVDEDGVATFDHIEKRARYDQHDPSGGFGYTISQDLRDSSGKQSVKTNQELTLAPTALPAGSTEISTINNTGERNPFASLSETGYDFHPSSPQNEQERFLQMMLDAEKSQRESMKKQAAARP
jgi:hypothetical protein